MLISFNVKLLSVSYFSYLKDYPWKLYIPSDFQNCNFLRLWYFFVLYCSFFSLWMVTNLYLTYIIHNVYYFILRCVDSSSMRWTNSMSLLHLQLHTWSFILFIFCLSVHIVCSPYSWCIDPELTLTRFRLDLNWKR